MYRWYALQNKFIKHEAIRQARLSYIEETYGTKYSSQATHKASTEGNFKSS